MPLVLVIAMDNVVQTVTVDVAAAPQVVLLDAEVTALVLARIQTIYNLIMGNTIPHNFFLDFYKKFLYNIYTR